MLIDYFFGKVVVKQVIKISETYYTLLYGTIRYGTVPIPQNPIIVKAVRYRTIHIH